MTGEAEVAVHQISEIVPVKGSSGPILKTTGMEKP
jgi:hypothetical protein